MSETNVAKLTPVVCDFCAADFTNSDRTGGFLFQSKAVCPDCAARTLPEIKSYGEEHFIRARCPEGKSFAQWVREDLRDPDDDGLVHVVNLDVLL